MSIKRKAAISILDVLDLRPLVSIQIQKALLRTLPSLKSINHHTTSIPTPALYTGASHVRLYERLCHFTRLSLPYLRPSHTCTIPPTLLHTTPHLHHTVPQWRPNGVPSRPTRTHSLPDAPGGVSPSQRCQSESCAPLVRCARSRRARGGACRVVAVIVCGRQPSAGRRAGRLSPAARAPRRGCSAPCAP